MSSNILNIRIIGCGCSLCETMASNVKCAADRVNVEYKLKLVCDHATKMTPILFINDKLVIAGKVLSIDELVSKLEAVAIKDIIRS